jgi:hypothetical protein
MNVGYTTCPECGAPAEIRQRSVLESTDGPIEHATVGCIRRHWFTLPIASLERTVTAATAVVADA